MRKVISDTSCLIVLSNIGQLVLLRDVYGCVTITEEVAEEFREPLPGWIEVSAVKDPVKTMLIAKSLDRGEASTLALAMEQENALVILDDGKARQFAEGCNITFTGTLGVIMKAKEMGYLTDIKKIIADFRRCGFRIPNNLENILFD